MVYDTSKTDDNWDSFAPDPPAEAPAPMQPEQPFNQPSSPIAGTQMPKQPGFRLSPRLLGIPIFLGVALFGWIGNRGTTSAGDLQPGDCFVMPSSVEFHRLDTEACDASHDGQIVSIATVASTLSLPADGDVYWDSVFEKCLESGDAVRVNDLPPDYELGFFSPNQEAWDDGDRTSLCYVYSPTGLSGSMMIGS